MRGEIDRMRLLLGNVELWVRRGDEDWARLWDQAALGTAGTVTGMKKSRCLGQGVH